MKEKLLELVTESVPLLFAAFLASIGGAIHYFNKIDRSGVPFKAFNFFLEVFTSGFVGIVAFMLCDSAGWEWHFTAAVVAISGHMGARALFIFEKLILIPTLRRYGYGDSERKTRRKKENNHDA